MARRLAWGHGLAAAVLIGLYFAVPAWHVVTWSLFGLLGCAAIVAGWRLHRPRRALPWLWWAGGTVALAVGAVAVSLPGAVPHGAASPWWAEAGLLPCLVVALVTSRRFAADRTALIDASILAIGAGLLSWVLVVEPHLPAPGLTVVRGTVSVAYPALLAVVARSMVGAVRGWSAALFLLSGAGPLVADILYGLELPVDWRLGWILFLVSGGAAALHPSMRTLTEPRPVGTGDSTARRLAIGAASLVAPLIPLGQASTREVRDRVVRPVVSAELVELDVTRMSHVDAGLRRALDRERELRRACEALLSATDVETVTAVVHESVGRLLPRGASDDNVLVDLRQAVPVLAGQAATAIDRIALIRELDRRDSEAYFRTLVLTAAEVILIVDDGGRIRYGSPSATGLLGVDDVTGRPVWDLFVPEQRDAVSAAVEAVRLGTVIDSAGDWTVLRHTGGPVEVEVSIRDLRHEPSVDGVVLTLRDVTERRRQQHELERRAYLDPLTGLGSHLFFRDETRRATAAPGVTGVLLADLDDLRGVAGTVGPELADGLLRAVGARLRFIVDGAHAVARLDGDEFGVLVAGAAEVAGIDRLVAGLLDRFTAPFEVSGSTITVRLTIGLATTVDTDDPAELISRARVALRTAKATGTGFWRRYDAALHREILDRAPLRTELGRAIATDGLELCFQPIVDLATGRAHGFESLVRWRHPVRGPLPADALVDLAGESGLTAPLGAWALERSVREAAGWQEALAEPPYVSVDVPDHQFRAPGFVEHVLTLISRYGLAPHLLTLEVTGSLIADSQPVREDLSILRSAGIRVAIDDFGTGHPSLSCLQGVPVDVLKLHRSFVDTMSGSIRRYDLVAGIAHLARTLRVDVVAQGIATTTERTLSSGAGCAYGQGTLIAEPMPADEVVPWLTHEDTPVFA
ncbi:hypothetical protein GCM10009557_15110 [Virgisporangium ochraceum]